MAEAVDELSITQRLLHGVEIGTLDILDDRDLENLGFVEIADDHGEVVQLRLLRGAPTSFAGNDLKMLSLCRVRAHDEWLDHALFADRCRKLGNGRFGEMATRLFCVGLDAINRDSP